MKDTLTAKFHNSIDAFDASEWNAMVDPDYPHLSHEFLTAAEHSQSVSNETGWQANHLGLYNEDKLVGAMPLYQKSHSWGEFVFDWSWADAYRRAGLEYYPKLISATPFTPATAPKMLTTQTDEAEAHQRALLDAVLSFARQHAFSSWHLQFVATHERALCEANGLMLREDCQFHWHNRNYTDFDDFLSNFSSKKRKNVKRERRRIKEAGIQHQIVAGDAITDAQMADAWRLCSYTFMVRGHTPYLNLDFFNRLRTLRSESLALVLASDGEDTVAAAILLRGESTLFGRYWGSEAHHHSLHFETCYYQGIEYCIREGLQRFEPGTQGEHKVSRGFLPVATQSAHWLAHPQFASAIGDYLEREASGVERYKQAIAARSPFKRNPEADAS
ncbi:MAG: GNAT family N-acetyltransferase [Pseudomonadota bacterium]